MEVSLFAYMPSFSEHLLLATAWYHAAPGALHIAQEAREVSRALQGKEYPVTWLRTALHTDSQAATVPAMTLINIWVHNLNAFVFFMIYI